MKNLVLIILASVFTNVAFAGGTGSGNLGDGSKGGTGGTSRAQTSDEMFDESELTVANQDKLITSGGASKPVPNFSNRKSVDDSDPFNSADLANAKGGLVGDSVSGASRNSRDLGPRIIFYQGETPKTIYYKSGEPLGNQWIIEQQTIHKGVTPINLSVMEALRQSALTRGWSKIQAPKYSR